ncbi:ArsR/SmtB family transcription factor [Pelagovum pacificum]|uniref:Helix-turn-helix transcriptional regulator n=1 Tax=Pelagovum pacificum TaxID=2588711 RepID=A0A5C5GDE6_9RHOB|nr:metalloregulator ArsR/SmtB family transcription factor [Pelagovum pacificum]QQA41182.1 helix-turn-helix transcriptional regulator [Pelagovum pacificum]TNY32009.1 helix-turn-helix transcriptional regulator [Pelagovum pacificum]
METTDASDAFSALGQPIRLAVLRLLIRAGHDGMTAGDIATAQDARANTMSSHLATLSAAGLVTSVREGRHIRYRADMDRLGGLISFLVEDCCGGRPELCRPVVESLSAKAC